MVIIIFFFSRQPRKLVPLRWGYQLHPCDELWSDVEMIALERDLTYLNLHDLDDFLRITCVVNKFGDLSSTCPFSIFPSTLGGDDDR